MRSILLGRPQEYDREREDSITDTAQTSSRDLEFSAYPAKSSGLI